MNQEKKNNLFRKLTRNRAGTGESRPRGKEVKEGKNPHRVWWVLGTIGLIMVTTMVIFICIFMTYVNTTLKSDLDVDVENIALKLSSKIMYYNSDSQQWEELQTLYADENRIPVNYKDLPDYVVKALIAIEDRRFYQHQGVDWLSTGKAVFTMFFGSANRGGSTLTQQLIKNLTQEDDVTVKRKVTEIFRALELEQKITKEEIIELYLNVVYFGHKCYGIGAAAKTYFGKEVGDLTLAEAAAIIGITNSPSANDPLRSEMCRTRCLKRKNLILDEMLAQEKIDQATHDAAVAQELIFVGDEGYVAQETETTENNPYYSYFVDQVIRDVQAELVAQKGITEATASTLLYNAGYTIYCTMDAKAQAAVDAVYNNADNLPYISTGGQHLQSAITIVDPSTGYVVAQAGGIGEKEGSLTLNRATRCRPCGSAIKPVSIYSAAVELGQINLGTVIDDYPVTYDQDLQRVWPANVYSGYWGLCTIQLALQQSINTCAVRTLKNLGLNNSYSWMIDNMGFTTLEESDKNLSALGLGGLTKGVTTQEMAAAYATFANNGIYNKPRTFLRVEDPNGQTVLETQAESHIAMSENTAYVMNDLLNQIVTVGGGTEAHFNGMTMAGKTGTTTNKYDRYFVGYTPYYCAAIWVGYDYMEYVNASGNPAAQLWKKVMEPLHEGLPNRSFLSQAGSDMEAVQLCTKSGKLASDLCTACGDVHTVLIPKDQIPEETCDMHVSVQVCEVTEEDGSVKYYMPNVGCASHGNLVSKIMLDYDRVLIGYPAGVEADGETPITKTVVARDSSNNIQELEICPHHDSSEPDPLDPGGGEEGEHSFWDDIREHLGF